MKNEYEIRPEFFELLKDLDSYKIFNKEYTPKIIPSNPEKAPKKEKLLVVSL